MPVTPRIRFIEFLSPAPENPDSGSAEIRVHLEDGGSSCFGALTPSHVAHRMNEAGQDFTYGAPAPGNFHPKSVAMERYMAWVKESTTGVVEEDEPEEWRPKKF